MSRIESGKSQEKTVLANDKNQHDRKPGKKMMLDQIDFHGMTAEELTGENDLLSRLPRRTASASATARSSHTLWMLTRSSASALQKKQEKACDTERIWATLLFGKYVSVSHDFLQRTG